MTGVFSTGDESYYRADAARRFVEGGAFSTKQKFPSRTIGEGTNGDEVTKAHDGGNSLWASAQYVLIIIIGVSGDTGRCIALLFHDMACQGVSVFNADSKMVDGLTASLKQIHDGAVMGSRRVETAKLQLNRCLSYIRYDRTFGIPVRFQHIPIENMAIHRLKDPVSVWNCCLGHTV